MVIVKWCFTGRLIGANTSIAPVGSSAGGPTFPRTVPRVTTLQRNSRSSANDLDSQQQQQHAVTNHHQQMAPSDVTDPTLAPTGTVAAAHSQRLQQQSASGVAAVPGGRPTGPIPLWRRQDHDELPTCYNANRCV